MCIDIGLDHGNKIYTDHRDDAQIPIFTIIVFLAFHRTLQPSHVGLDPLGIITSIIGEKIDETVGIGVIIHRIAIGRGVIVEVAGIPVGCIYKSQISADEDR